MTELDKVIYCSLNIDKYMSDKDYTSIEEYTKDRLLGYKYMRKIIETPLWQVINA